MKKANVSKNKASLSKKHKQSKKQEQKKEKGTLEVPKETKEKVSLIDKTGPESSLTWPMERVFDQRDYLGTDSSAVQEITILYKEEEEKDPDFKEVNEWLEKIGEEKGGDEDEE